MIPFLHTPISVSSPVVMARICVGNRRTSVQLVLEHDALSSEHEGTEMCGGADDDEKAYPDVAADPDRMESREYLVDSNFEPDYGTDEEEECEDVEMGCRYDDEDVDRPVIHFDRDNPTIDEGTVFDNVEDCRYAVATYAIRVGFEFIIEKSDQKRFRVHCRESNVCKWRLHASPMRGGHPFQVAIATFSFSLSHIYSADN